MSNKSAKLLGVLAAMAAVSAWPQSFNIDLDIFFGEPYIGNGAPSSGFGAAASQPGYWNRIPSVNGGPPIPLAGLDGVQTEATIFKSADNPGGTGGFNFPSNSGDFALLLNDAEQVATIVSGGNLTYTFSGLAASSYEVYTYAVRTQYVETPIFVPEAVKSNTQVVTGPMPGNSFEYLVTHSIHRIELQPNSEFHVSITQPPNHPQGMYVNGIQIKSVPEPTFALATGIVTFYLLRFRKSHKQS